MSETGGGHTISFVNTGRSPIRLGQFGVRVVRESRDSVAIATRGGVGLGVRVAPAGVRSSKRGDVTGLVGPDLAGYAVAAGETLVVHAGDPSTQLRVDGEPGDGDRDARAAGIAIAIPYGDSWAAYAKHHPSTNNGFWMAGEAADSVRLVFDGAHTILALDGIRATESPAVSYELPRVDLWHSRLGSLDPANLNADSSALLPGERLAAGFVDTLTSNAPHRLFLVVGTAPAAMSASARRSEPATVPASFALSPNEPNPFGDGTIFRFALPTPSHVKLEVFDLSGRRVRTLTDAAWVAGYHALRWDGRSERRARLGPGIYLCRMTAGSFRASRKVAIVP